MCVCMYACVIVVSFPKWKYMWWGFSWNRILDDDSQLNSIADPFHQCIIPVYLDHFLLPQLKRPQFFRQRITLSHMVAASSSGLTSILKCDYCCSKKLYEYVVTFLNKSFMFFIRNYFHTLYVLCHVLYNLKNGNFK